MRGVLATLAVIVIVAGAVFYGFGWLTVHKTPTSATIEIKTSEIKEAADRAVEQGKEMMHEATDPKPTTIPVQPETPVVVPTPGGDAVIQPAPPVRTLEDDRFVPTTQP